MCTPAKGIPKDQMFLDRQSVHLMRHGVLVHHVLVKFLARDLSLDIRDEVLNVFDGLTLLSDLLEVVRRGVVGYEKLVKICVAHVKNLDEGTELMNLRHNLFCVRSARRP